MKRLLSFALLCSCALRADVIETYDFAELLTVVDERCLLVCDIENTLIRPGQYLGSMAWALGYVKKLEGLGLSHENAMAEMSALTKRVLLCSNSWLVEERIPSVINHLQAQGTAVMGCTNRMPSCGFLTSDALAQEGIFLSLTAPEVRGDVKGGVFIEGVLYAEETGEKGHALAALIERLGVKRVVIVDDRYKSLQKVLWALEELEIDVTGVWYRAGERWYADFDSRLAEIQLTHFGRILSDEDAEKLLLANVSR
jgi:Protein of unknown function (DUF2608)